MLAALPLPVAIPPRKALLTDGPNMSVASVNTLIKLFSLTDAAVGTSSYKIKAPATAPAIIIPEHGHYPQNQTEDQNEPFTVELSKTPAQLSVQSLKVDSDEAP